MYKPMFAKPGPHIKEPSRVIDPEYVKWIHGYACVVCGSFPTHAHHVKRRSQGGSDRTCLPLCMFHHTGQQGVHLLGVIRFQASFGIDMDVLVTQFNLLYDKGEKGPHSHKIYYGDE